ncbi:hypothetical protein D781_3149 [Serratia sp. FGI94]|uniref:hypothetical protein n=1 Tax=Serratia sp. FGI94 TaxID=671990 RepID=UPI0002A714D4|nr:hypothetical protein [Serratia sp. FGI94]AGB83380.1 hypothetical protein D781_3149 [Serratia sp. FGI94]
MISILLDVGTILSFLAIFIGFLTMIFFGINRKKYKRIVSLYANEGLYMNDFNQLAVYFGYLGSYFPTNFFNKLLKNKNIRTGKDTFVPSEAYTFLQSLPRELTGWITTYHRMHIIWSTLFLIGCTMLGIVKVFVGYPID